MAGDSAGATVDAEMNFHLDAVVDRLVNATGASIRRHELRALVDECYGILAENARLTNFLPLLTERYARSQLRTRALAAGKAAKAKPEILIIDRHNAARSQSAAALVRFYAPGRFEVTSAGIEPGGLVDERVIAMLRERGVELTDFPKPLTDDVLAVADQVVIIAHKPLDLPEFDAPVVARWDVRDPEQFDDEQLLAQLADTDTKVRALLAEIDADHPLHPPVFH